MEKVFFKDLGRINFKEAWDYQELLFNEIVDRKMNNRNLPPNLQKPLQHHLLFCEHPPVYTLGKSGKMANLLIDKKNLDEYGIDFFKINRGGDITFHGPGQIVGYPLLDLDGFFTDIHKYMRLLEEVIIRALEEYGIEGGRMKKATGVWIDVQDPERTRKICAIGVRCSRWVTMHGFALNVNTDLSYFKNIVPCGIFDKDVTSMEKEIGAKLDVREIREKLKTHFSEVFNAELTIQ